MTKRFVRRAQHRQACLLGIVYNIMCAHTHSHKCIILHALVQATSSVGSISFTDCKCNPGYTYVITPLSCPHPVFAIGFLAAFSRNAEGEPSHVLLRERPRVIVCSLQGTGRRVLHSLRGG